MRSEVDRAVYNATGHDTSATFKNPFQVARWALLAYAIIAGMIEFAFVFDHTRGSQLVVMTTMLALFMLNVPVLIGFTVARYQRAG